jgi:hypothetical protein
MNTKGRVCHSCGAPIGPLSTQTEHCTYCGASVSVDPTARNQFVNDLTLQELEKQRKTLLKEIQSRKRLRSHDHHQGRLRLNSIKKRILLLAGILFLTGVSLGIISLTITGLVTATVVVIHHLYQWSVMSGRDASVRERENASDPILESLLRKLANVESRIDQLA